MKNLLEKYTESLLTISGHLFAKGFVPEALLEVRETAIELPRLFFLQQIDRFDQNFSSLPYLQNSWSRGIIVGATLVAIMAYIATKTAPTEKICQEHLRSIQKTCDYLVFTVFVEPSKTPVKIVPDIPFKSVIL